MRGETKRTRVVYVSSETRGRREKKKETRFALKRVKE